MNHILNVRGDFPRVLINTINDYSPRCLLVNSSKAMAKLVGAKAIPIVTLGLEVSWQPPQCLVFYQCSKFFNENLNQSKILRKTTVSILTDGFQIRGINYLFLGA